MNPMELSCGQIEEIVRQHGTPLYIASRQKITSNFARLNEALPAAKIYYALKANPHEGILKALLAAGAGFDVASKGEIQAALQAGANPRDDLIFADTVKDPKHIAYADSIGLDDFTFDNHSEITQIARHAPGAKVHLRLAVANHGSVAQLSEKFGAQAGDAVQLLSAAKDHGLQPFGISFHVGSQCLNNQNWVDALAMTRAVFDATAAAGMELSSVDIGGGFPVQYEHETIDILETCGVISSHFKRLFGNDVLLVAEPGRGIVGDAVILVTKVISEAKRNGHDWLYFDDGTYGSFMEVLLYKVRYPLRTNTMGPVRPYILAGPTCDSIDVFSRDHQGKVTSEHLPEMHLDDLLIAGSMGAYTYSEATHFNGFEPPDFFYLD